MATICTFAHSHICTLTMHLHIVQQRFHPKSVRVESEATDDTATSGRYHRVVTKLLALVNIADMYLNHREVERTNAVMQGNACVGISPRVEYGAFDAFSIGLLQAVY